MFLCTGNSCRSQMAEGLLRHVAGDRFEVVSAGTQPVGVNPGAVEVMREASPIYPSAASVLHWSLDDPAAAQGPADIRRAVFRRVRDDIAERIRHFIDDQQ